MLIHLSSSSSLQLQTLKQDIPFISYISFLLAVCSTLSKGIFALFGVTNTSSLRTSESLTSTFNMPYVTPSSPVNHSYEPSGFLLRMRPSYENAITDIVEHYKWGRVFYIYDSPEGKSLRLIIDL